MVFIARGAVNLLSGMFDSARSEDRIEHGWEPGLLRFSGVLDTHTGSCGDFVRSNLRVRISLQYHVVQPICRTTKVTLGLIRFLT